MKPPDRIWSSQDPWSPDLAAGLDLCLTLMTDPPFHRNAAMTRRWPCAGHRKNAWARASLSFDPNARMPFYQAAVGRGDVCVCGESRDLATGKMNFDLTPSRSSISTKTPASLIHCLFS